uniref:KIB1-4 beta-propeller domain-containing protein n=1 Tax=Leersia perrieri TaxID=77586 RepID=A0A0D9WER2_9ORYZ
MSSSSSHRPVLPCLAVEHGTNSDGQSKSTAFFSAADAESNDNKKPVAAAAVLALPPELLESKPSAVFCPTPLGWILVRECGDAATGSGITYLLHPQAPEKKIQLPPLRGIDDGPLIRCNCLLSDQPTSPAGGCVILLVQQNDTVIWYHRISSGSDVWIRREYDIGTQGDDYFREKIPIVPIAAYQGKFYFNCTPTDMGVLHFSSSPDEDPVFSSITTDAVPSPWGKGGSARVFLLESNGELYMVHLTLTVPRNFQPLATGSSSYPAILVYRMDFSHRRWLLVKDLRDRAFFVASPNSFGASCLAAAAGVEPNCVYSICNKSFTIYNIKNGTSRVHSFAHPSESIRRMSWMLPTDPKA